MTSSLKLGLKLRTLFCAIPLLAAMVSQPVLAEVVTIDRVVALVNKNAITQLELNRKVTAIKANLERQKVKLPPDNVLQQQVLEKMILDQLQIQYAEMTGLKVDDKQLENAINNLAEQNKLTVPEFRKRLESNNIPWRQFREEIRQEIIMARLKEREIDSRVVVTESEINDYLKLSEGKMGMEYLLAQIQVNIPENASPEIIQAKRARIQAALEEINAGKSFETVAASYSNDPNATKGGNLGWRPAGSLPPAFTSLLEKTPIGSMTDVVRTPVAFHIFKLLDKRTEEQRVIMKQTHARHILIRSNEIVSTDDARTKLLQIRERIMSGQDFATMAKSYSDDITAAKGGDLGWLSPGETVPQFEEAMNALQLNEISMPVQSPFGFHLIQALERRDQDVTKEQARFKIRNELKQRKAEEQYDDWLRQLRDRARVVIRLKDE
ncbi:peptidylprolyl isomerase [Chitinibacter bivalviorum]|uniref:Chaperone SurA n=1 Tax=Chitinibacter bivalviorum TaxID=2739434 RepID=A0A7H9BJZ8_9NEIS|nr:peptidylprolyl isomerase [Chitinibacter bivalviorum]QLG88588.1 peptidylprolyl isomerase [Chitinibacter bivalviorum]